MVFGPLKEQIKQAKRIVFVTGAGMSQESGIPTFRGKEGYWRNYDPMKLATIAAFYQDPVLVWEWYNERRRNILAAQPNSGHWAIAELEKFVEVVILTQNIDGLHQRSGSSNVLELHGSIIKIKCTVCSFKDTVQENFKTSPPLCECGGMLRPDVVWFGESLDQEIWNRAINYASETELMIIVGTSLVVSPANSLPMYTKQNDGILVEINPNKTENVGKMDLAIQQTSSQAIPELVKIFQS